MWNCEQELEQALKRAYNLETEVQDLKFDIGILAAFSAALVQSEDLREFVSLFDNPEEAAWILKDYGYEFLEPDAQPKDYIVAIVLGEIKSRFEEVPSSTTLVLSLAKKFLNEKQFRIFKKYFERS